MRPRCGCGRPSRRVVSGVAASVPWRARWACRAPRCKAKAELRTLERLAQAGRIQRTSLTARVQKALSREHLSRFVVVDIGGNEKAPTLRWHVDTALRHRLETTRLGRRVLCTDRHVWSTGRIVHAFRGQWNVEEIFRRAKKGGLVPWGPSHQWADGSLRLHTFATVLGLMLVSLAKIALGTATSPRVMMQSLAAIRATLVRTTTGGAATYGDARAGTQ